MSVQTSRQSSVSSGRSHSPAKSGGNVIDPIRVLRQNLTLFIVTGVLGLIAGTGAFLATSALMPEFEGVSTYRLLAEIGGADDALGSDNRNEDTVARLASTEAAIAISEPLLRQVIDSDNVQTIDWIQQWRTENDQLNPQEALIELMDEISASHVKRTEFFQIKWRAQNPDDVLVLLSEVQGQYDAQRQRSRDRRLDEAIQPYQNKLDEIDDLILTLEGKIKDEIGQNSILGLNDDSGSMQEDLTARELERNELLSALEMGMGTQGQLNAKLNGIADPEQEDIRNAEADIVVRQALTEIQLLRGILAEHRQSFGPEHSQVKKTERQLDARIREKDRKIQEIINRNLAAELTFTSNQIESLTRTERMLAEEIDVISQALIESTANLASLRKLESRLDRQEERRAEIIRQMDDIRAVFLRDDSDAVQLVTAVQRPTEAVWPMWYTMIPGVTILSLFLVAGLVFLREMLDQRIRSTNDLSTIPGSRILGVIPDLKDDPTDASRAETVVRDHTSSVVAESYRQFATAFRKARGEAGARTVLFSSGMPDAGTTSVVLNLAATAVAAGRSVAIVDANFRRPRIGSILGFDSEAPGFGDVLCEAASIDDVIQTTSDGISVIPAGTTANRVIERFDGESAGRFLKDIGSRFDVLLIDGPPLVVASESMSIAHAVDATVLVVRAFSEHRGLVARLIRQLNEHSGVLLGVVLNRPRNTAGGYFRRNYEAIAAYSNDQDPD